MSHEELDRTARLFVPQPLLEAWLALPVRLKGATQAVIRADSGALILRRERSGASSATLAALTLRMRTSTVTTGDYNIDERLRSTRELHVVEYPFWTLDADVTARSGVNSWTATGALEARGITAPCELAVSLHQTGDEIALYAAGIVGRHRGARRSSLPILRSGGAFEVHARLRGRRQDVVA